MKKLFTSILIVGILGSCSIDKRLYRPGYSVKWNNSSTTAETNKKASITEIVENNSEVNTAENSSTEDILTASSDNSFVLVPKAQNPFFANQGKSVEKTGQTFENKTVISKKINKVKKKDEKKSSTNDGGKSQLVALLLCIFIGVLGIHRFYLGYTGIGILMLLTAGVCGILALIDLIRIITGDLKPRNGDYSEKL
jgi:TM2 domain-containing membrane protein YozV